MAFATSADVSVRLGRTLTTEEDAMVEMVIDQVTEMIAEIAGSAADDIDPVPAYYRALCVEKALAVGSNPNQVASRSEQLGAHQHSETFRGGRNVGSDLFLTEHEEYLIRRIANNAVSGSTRTRALPHEVYVTEDE